MLLYITIQRVKGAFIQYKTNLITMKRWKVSHIFYKKATIIRGFVRQCTRKIRYIALHTPPILYDYECDAIDQYLAEICSTSAY